ncbi:MULTISPECIES: lipid II:glycine glycyltransferase FemX [Aerococcus]|uniref:Lipid II:glycine glycyltransferase FemX n=1 Tax=Aerococcus mictus TaxID=2976810 RepID=A0A9Q4H706_9LACT|nr:MULTISPECIES: lipid II:glycine glycyltransferase FemX [Aerococcus]AEA01326.1 aminoacyltransferase FemX [Aerococcus sp. Group 1]MCY3031326.1 lipid II:glycine glycyltransferase FemX [Aerococcus sp. Group 1]MCY3040187.1 lipid II:glycine glycyltransferase FemX [Aerococcus sp. Group 2]MCY3041910.1 lipid II:glycine glycyltransferase FemX [Aerococcus sp. Group 2]MCY3043580.1 lipid II:glycine glycyltransferase FemX [Aerococcus sp. Group 2]
MTQYHSVQLSDADHNHFVENNQNGDLLQLTDWAKAKEFTGWYSKNVAVADEAGQVQAVANIQFKKIKGTPLTFAYASRGFVVDYDNHDAVAAITQAAVKAAKEEHAVYLKIDPDLERQGNEETLKLLETLGFRHTGFKDGMSEQYIQPRQTMYTPIDQSDEDLLNSYEAKTRNLVRKAMKSGLEVFEGSREELDVFHRLMEETGERDGFATRDISYFEALYDNLHPQGHLYYFMIKLMPDKMEAEARQELALIAKDREKVEARRDSKKKDNQLKELATRQAKQEKLIADADDLRKDHPNGLPLSAAILCFCGKKAYYLYAASSNHYRKLSPNYQLQYDLMRFARDKGATTYDFGGVSVDPDEDSPYRGLWVFKRMWGTKVSDKIGEFDYVLIPGLYQMMTYAIPRVRHFMKGFRNKGGDE